MQLPLEDYELYEELTEDFQLSFILLPRPFLLAVDKSVVSGEIQQEVLDYKPKLYTEEWRVYEKLVKLFSWMRIVCEKVDAGPQLTINLRQVLDVLAPRASFVNMN